MENNVEHDDTDAKRIQEVGPETVLKSRICLHSETQNCGIRHLMFLKQIGALYILINGNCPVFTS